MPNSSPPKPQRGRSNNSRTLKAPRNPKVSNAARHADWLGLVDPLGPFLTLSVLRRRFPTATIAPHPNCAPSCATG
jgi:hypothetical protein